MQRASYAMRFLCGALPVQCALPMQCVRPMQCAPPLQCARTVVPPHHMLHHCTQLLGRHNLLCCIGRAYDMAVWTQKAARLKAPTVEVSALERMLTKFLTTRGSRDLDGLLHDLAGQTSKTAPRPADMQQFEDICFALFCMLLVGFPVCIRKKCQRQSSGATSNSLFSCSTGICRTGRL